MLAYARCCWTSLGSCLRCRLTRCFCRPGGSAAGSSVRQILPTLSIIGVVDASRSAGASSRAWPTRSPITSPSTARWPSAVAGLRSPSESGHQSLAKLTIFQGAKGGANGGRRQATHGDVRRRSVQLTGSSGYVRRCPATVRSRLTSEGSLVRTQLHPPDRQPHDGSSSTVTVGVESPGP